MAPDCSFGSLGDSEAHNVYTKYNFSNQKAARLYRAAFLPVERFGVWISRMVLLWSAYPAAEPFAWYLLPKQHGKFCRFRCLFVLSLNRMPEFVIL